MPIKNLIVCTIQYNLITIISVVTFTKRQC